MGAAKKLYTSITHGEYVSTHLIRAFDGRPRPSQAMPLFGDDLPRAMVTHKLAEGFGLVESTERPDCVLCGGTEPRCVALCERALRLAPLAEPAKPAKPAKVAARKQRSLFGDQDLD